MKTLYEIPRPGQTFQKGDFFIDGVDREDVTSEFWGIKIASGTGGVYFRPTNGVKNEAIIKKLADQNIKLKREINNLTKENRRLKMENRKPDWREVAADVEKNRVRAKEYHSVITKLKNERDRLSAREHEAEVKAGRSH